ncbi:myc box-dependent-interacting protein 1 isoform X1 [Bactrocera neohumeralis]|uniref:myc box-dependent-interacting protein 1 isoform X1 n=1 Tax=Bactrocera neohumeralis TaxID=98809 RepID=UPI002165C97E|nr:myc box-dependent-interacting protein 1 isoform X1 [Bactrocera neohumeralis]
MAENKGIMLAKSVQKHAGRAKEKILQNLGKVDRTADDIFDDHLNNFNRQQTNANRLQKEFNNYIRCIRAAQTASKSLMDAISEIYEPHWVGYDALQAQTGAAESLWQDFAHKLADQVLIPLNTYTGQFPEMKKKVDKRNRKLIDYDGQRHSFQSLQANANKRKDDVKLTKGREQLEEARRTYEILNTELHDELPALYDSRILFLVTNLQTLFATEQVFHNETAKIYSELEAIVDKLATDSQRGSNTLRKQTSKFMESTAFSAPSPTKTSPFKQMNNTNTTNNSNYQNQITTNGSSNVNSPSSTSTSSSHQTSRLDSVSPTPESTPENLKAADNAAAAANISSPSTGPASTPGSSPLIGTITPPPYQSAATDLLANATRAATLNNSNSNGGVEQRPLATPDSPNANTTLPPAAAGLNDSAAAAEAKSNAAVEVQVNNKENDVSNAPATTTAPNATNPDESSSSNTARKSLKLTPEQLNGNANGNISENAAAPQSTNADANVNVNANASTAAATAAPQAAATPTPTATDVNNGNATDETNKKSGGKVIQKSPKRHKAQLLNPLNLIRKSRAAASNKSESVVVVEKRAATNDLNIIDNVATTDKNVDEPNLNIEKSQKVAAPVSKNPFEDDEQIYEIPTDATTSDLPAGVLYRVKATYGYVKEDVDELSFEVGDIIRVIEYDDPEDQEEGWLMGQKEGTNEKGLFPANFTRPI